MPCRRVTIGLGALVSDVGLRLRCADLGVDLGNGA
jgi:hypothetical protein